MRHPALDGVVRVLPLAPGILPLGLVFGAAAAEAGLSPWAATLLSAGVFAGGAQFAAVALLASGGALFAIVGLVAVVNSRYFLLSAAALDLARRAGASPSSRVLVALGVVDESYALQAAAAREGPPTVVGMLAITATLWTLWVSSTLAGAYASDLLPDLRPYGLDYALPGIFVGLFGIFADTRERLLAGVAALVAGGLLALVGLGTVAVLVVPVALALGLGRWGPR